MGLCILVVVILPQRQGQYFDNEDDIEIEDDQGEDGFKFKSETDAQAVLIATIRFILEKFPLDVTKNIIFKACKDNSIELIKPRTRESAPNVKQMNVSEIRDRINKFGSAALEDLDIDFDLDLEDDYSEMQQLMLSEFDADQATALASASTQTSAPGPSRQASQYQSSSSTKKITSAMTAIQQLVAKKKGNQP